MAKVRVVFEAVTSAFSRGITRMESKLTAFKQRAGKMFSGLKAAAAPLLALAGVAMGIGALKGVIDELDNLGKSARNLGLTGEELQKFQHAARSVNFPVEQLQPSLDKMRKLIGDAFSGVPAAQSKLAMLGVSLDELRGKSTAEQFDIVSGAILGIKDPTEQSAAAMGVFGEQGGKMLNFMREYKTLGAELEASGGVISNEEIKAAEEFNQACTDIAAALRSWAVDSGFIRTLKDLAELLRDAARSAKKLDQLAKNDVFDREHAVDDAIRRAEESGKYTPEEIGQMKKSRTGYIYKNETAAPWMETHYSLLDRALTEVGLGDFSRQVRDGKKGWDGTVDFGSRRKSPAERQAEARKVEEERRRSKEEQAAREKLREEERTKAAREKERQAEEARLEKIALGYVAKRERAAAGSGRIDEQLEGLAEQLKYQQLILQGKEREARIQKEIARAEKTARDAGTALTDDQRRNLIETAGRLYDAERPGGGSPEKAASRLPPVADREIFTDSLLRIGGVLGGRAASPAANYGKITADRLTAMETKLSALYDKIPGRTESRELIF